jgi:oxygen-independent coproporphyrinogen-3 oxidase
MLKLIRNIMSDSSDDFTFRAFNNSLDIAPNEGSGLYVHIPFCMNTCPYCPYFKVKYDPITAGRYKDALIHEIKSYRRMFGKRKFSSLYFGGGTPTLMIDMLPEIVQTLKDCFHITGDIALETSPSDINFTELERLKQSGFNLISIGIQSFCNKHLGSLGRNYKGDEAKKALEKVVSTGFETVNVDLIFAYHDQSLKELQADLETALNCNADQITCYPLFTFPYSEIGRMKRLKKLKLPNHFKRRKLYFFINDFLRSEGYKRTNVWSFSKHTGSGFSSVTRNYYLGIGAGSGSYKGDIFYFNTFSLPAYLDAVKNKLPISLAMKVSEKLQKNLWLYWQLYTTEVDVLEYQKLFNSSIKKDFGMMFRIFKLMNFIDEENDRFINLNTAGSHWIHLIQNYYALNYVTKIWERSKKEAWPEQIKL